MGEKEKEPKSRRATALASPLLERAAYVSKLHFLQSVRDYVRTHLLKEHRETSIKSIAKSNEPTQTPLNVADYARVPLLNPDQKVKDWREKLPALENEYDSRMISLGKVDSGVYLIEAVNEGMRAYSIAIVTNLTMIEKTNRHGQVVVYVVDRKTGAPHEGVSASKSPRPSKPWRPARPTRPASSKLKSKFPRLPKTPAEDVDPESETGMPI